jgi:16S rRNA (uracil1498-N3)-methyltransferase
LRADNTRPIIARVARRIHVAAVRVGHVTLNDAEAHHARDVLRLEPGDAVEVFDDGGRIAHATLTALDPAGVTIEIQQLIQQPNDGGIEITIATAVPKGDRADWMVEKLSELGVARFIPLVTERSVVHPTGRSKADRWTRLAIESAKQSRRSGVMRIDPLTPLSDVLKTVATAWFMSTQGASTPIAKLLQSPSLPKILTIFIGPEGGWTENEVVQFKTAGAIGVALTPTILRIETAAVTAAGVVACWSRESL